MTGWTSQKSRLQYLKITKEQLQNGELKMIQANNKMIDARNGDPEDIWLELRNEKDKAWEFIKQGRANEIMLGCSAEGETEGKYFTADNEDTGLYVGRILQAKPHALCPASAHQFAHSHILRLTHSHPRCLRSAGPGPSPLFPARIAPICVVISLFIFSPSASFCHRFNSVHSD